MYTIIHIKKNDEAYEYKDRVIEKVKTYFEEVLSAIRNSNNERLNYLSKHIHEAKYTNLGYSASGVSTGKGFGSDKFKFLVESIKKSEAYSSGTICDILDVELYVENIGVDLISDLITNLIQDILSEYTEKILSNLNMENSITHIDMHFWNEDSKEWENKRMPIIYYSKPPKHKIYNYLLVPEVFTSGDKQKEKIVQRIFDECVYGIYEKKIFSDPIKYEKYIHEYKGGDKTVFKNRVSRLMNHELGEGSAKEGHGYITGKGLLGLLENYEEVKKYIELEIKN